MRILIKDLRFEAIIGILEEERLAPQPVNLHVKIRYDYQKDRFINYADVALFLEHTMQEKKYYLLEDALEDLSQKLLTLYPQIKTVKLKILKPAILQNAIVGVMRKTKRNKN
jgi:dihydroneopterin aldolase